MSLQNFSATISSHYETAGSRPTGRGSSDSLERQLARTVARGEDAEADASRAALYARSRRTAGRGGSGRHRLSRAVRLGTRRVTGGWRLLYAQRLPHHEPAAQPVV